MKKRWYAMVRRCHNPKDKQFHDYGAQGITVCERWHDFEQFKADVGSPPFPRASLDRIDGTKGYEPGNVRWATSVEQSVNRKTTTWCWVGGQRMCIKHAAALVGIHRNTISEFARS